jgi:DNA-directed RNA polymerase subunit H (RpoH/RPB5)
MAQRRKADMPRTNRTDPAKRIVARKRSGGTIRCGRKSAVSQRVAAE